MFRHCTKKMCGYWITEKYTNKNSARSTLRVRFRSKTLAFYNSLDSICCVFHAILFHAIKSSSKLDGIRIVAEQSAIRREQSENSGTSCLKQLEWHKENGKPNEQCANDGNQRDNKWSFENSQRLANT